MVVAVTNASGAASEVTAEAGGSGDAGRRWVRVGHSWAAAARSAGVAATRQAMDGPGPRLVVVFASSRYSLPDVARGVSEVAGDVPVLGCSAVGEIGPGPVLSPGVVVVCFGGDFAVTTSWASGLRDQPRSVGEAIATALMPMPPTRYRFVLMLTDALAGDHQEMLRGAYGVLGATVPIIGGGSAGDSRRGMVQQIYNGQVMHDTVVAAVIGTDGPIGLSVRHGWRRNGDAMVVTDSEANEVFTLDDRPALDLYLDRYGASHETAADPYAFAAFAMTRPIAVARRGDIAMRHVLQVDVEHRSLIFGAGVPIGAAVWFATGDRESTLEATEAACADATGQLCEADPLALLVFNCAGRRAVLGDDGILAEVGAMRRRAGNAPIAGFYTYGEIARVRGIHAYHNQTIVAFALS